MPQDAQPELTDYQQRSLDLWKSAPFQAYLKSYHRAESAAHSRLESKGFQPDAAEQYMRQSSDSEICAFWNDIYFALPDNAGIRQPPFFRLCDLAEGTEDDDTEEA